MSFLKNFKKKDKTGDYGQNLTMPIRAVHGDMHG